MRTKVLFVIESLSGGGAEKVLSVLLKHIDKTKFDITLCTVVDTGVYVEEVKKYVRYTTIIGNPIQKTLGGKLWYQIKYKCVYNLLPMKWIYQLFVPKNNDVEVAFVEGFTTKLMAASTNKKAKKIAWVHTDLSLNPWTLTNIFSNVSQEKQAYKKFNHIITVSDTVRINFIKRYQINPKHILRIYNPLDKKFILEEAKETIVGLNLRNDRLVFITVGRLVPQKGYDRLLNAVNQLIKNNYDFELWILGEGKELDKLKIFIAENNLTNYIKIWGFQKNPYKYLKKSNCFICSSRAEGFSLVIAEAMILGLPIISTYCSGPNELLEEGEYGILVDNSEEGILNGLHKILETPQILKIMSEKSKERALNFNLTHIIKEIETILNKR